jgi:Tfp pilus assembly PilM family ATPase/cell division protein FtsB
LPRFIGIDWDHDSLYVLSGTTSRRSARIERAVVWQEPHTLDLAAAEDAGRRLRQRLKDARISAAPVLASVGRERVIFKELRIPAVDKNQEAALVRFQATKELTEAPGRVVMDYAVSPNGNGAERNALVAIVRKPWLQSLEALCKGAGLSLECAAPRSYGIARSLYQTGTGALAAPAPVAGTTVAILTLAKQSAEFTVVRDGEVRLARPLSASDNLLEDVRRNLALYANQAQVATSRETVQALYFAGDSSHAAVQERLREALAIPVHSLDPFAAEERVDVAGDRGGFAGLVGLAQLWASQNVPINFVAPKEPKPEKTNKARMGVLLGALAAVLVLGAWVLGQSELSKREQLVQEERRKLKDLEAQLERLKPDQQRLAALIQWDDSSLPWADELLELTRRFPQVEGFHATQLAVSSSSASAASNGPTIIVNIRGVVPVKQEEAVSRFTNDLNDHPYFKARLIHVKPVARQSEKENATSEFEISVIMTKDPAASVTAALLEGRPPSAKAISSPKTSATKPSK